MNRTNFETQALQIKDISRSFGKLIMPIEAQNNMMRAINLSADIGKYYQDMFNKIDFSPMYENILQSQRMLQNVFNSEMMSNINQINHEMQKALGNLRFTEFQTSFFKDVNLQITNVKINSLLTNVVVKYPSYDQHTEAEEKEEAVEKFNYDVLKKAVNQAIIDNDVLTRNEFEETVHEIVETIRSLKESSIIKEILLFILMTILTFVINTYVLQPTAHYIQSEYFSKNKSEVIQKISKSSIHLDIEIDYLKDKRFVSSEILALRETHRINSRIVGTLEFGDVARVIYKKRNWTMVEYYDEENNEIITGWVLTRYLKKFKLTR